MNYIIKFLESGHNKRKAEFVAAIAVLCALFLSIPNPDLEIARTSLGYVKLFWLSALTLGLASLFFDLIKFIWVEEIAVIKRYDLVSGAVITFFSTVILGGVLLHLWIYTLNSYSSEFAEFLLSIGFWALILIGTAFIGIWTNKNQKNIKLIFLLLIDSTILGVLIGFVGLYAHYYITKLYHWFWILPVTPLAIVIVFILFVVLSIFRKRKLFQSSVLST